ncbi:hypothetical protein U1Q18_012453 [Sarracenia purpurea var. burkii]
MCASKSTICQLASPLVEPLMLNVICCIFWVWFWVSAAIVLGSQGVLAVKVFGFLLRCFFVEVCIFLAFHCQCWLLPSLGLLFARITGFAVACYPTLLTLHIVAASRSSRMLSIGFAQLLDLVQWLCSDLLLVHLAVGLLLSSLSCVMGNKTDLVICSYEDHFLVIATQIGCMGTILHARKEEGMLIHPTFNVSVIFGKRDEPMLVACARQLIEYISSSGSSKPLVLSLGLKDHSTETLKGIVHTVIENRLW